MVRLKAGFWICAAVFVVASVVVDWVFVYHLKHGSHESAKEFGSPSPNFALDVSDDAAAWNDLGENIGEVTFVDVVRDNSSDYDRGFNDALENLALWLPAIENAENGVYAILWAPGMPPVTHQEWWGMDTETRFDVLRRMYGVEKTEDD
jgi:hypothetical protein